MGRQEKEDTALFAVLDQSLSTSANKDAILRATKVVFYRKGETPTAPATGLEAGTPGLDEAREAALGCGELDAAPSPPPLPPRSSTRVATSASRSFSPTQRDTVSSPQDDDECGSGNNGTGVGEEDQKPQLKAASSFFGNSFSRIRSAAKMIPPPAARTEDEDKLLKALLSKAKPHPLTDDARIRRGARLMKKVGLPRRRASCETPAAKTPSWSSTPPPPLPPRPPQPPRGVTEMATPDGSPPAGGDGDNAIAPAPPSPVARESQAGTREKGKKIGCTKSIILDGLRMVWTLEIRDSVVRTVLNFVHSYTKAAGACYVVTLPRRGTTSIWS